MLQRLPIALAQVKVGNTSKNSSSHIFFVSSKLNCEKSIQQCNEFNKAIKQNVYPIYEIDKDEYLTGKPYEPYILFLNLMDTINLKRSDKYVELKEK